MNSLELRKLWLDRHRGSSAPCSCPTDSAAEPIKSEYPKRRGLFWPPLACSVLWGCCSKLPYLHSSCSSGVTRVTVRIPGWCGMALAWTHGCMYVSRRSELTVSSYATYIVTWNSGSKRRDWRRWSRSCRPL